MIYFWILHFQLCDSVAALLIRLDVSRLSLELFDGISALNAC